MTAFQTVFYVIGCWFTLSVTTALLYVIARWVVGRPMPKPGPRK
jgi:hypothetical protein